MDKAQGAAGTGESEQTTQTTQQESKPEKLSPLQEAVRKELGIEAPVKSEEPPKEEPKEEEPKEEEPKEEEPEKPEEEPAEEGEAGEGPQEPAAAELAEGEEAEEHEDEMPENWPKTAKARVADEARKRRERTKERDQWKATAENLYAQLQETGSRQLPPSTALTEVVDRPSLTAAEKHWKEIRRFARTHPDGADDVLVGKDAQGNEIRRDYTREQIIQMGLDADEAFEALPARRAFIAEAEKQTEVAKKVYPDLFKDTATGREAAQVVQRAPWILQTEDWALCLGDYLAGRKARLGRQGKNGKPLSPQAQAILSAPKVTKAPGVIKSRSASSGPERGARSVARVDDKQANEEFYAKGMTSEALEEKIKRKLAASEAGQSGGKQAALV
jgi:hypothetical protein